MAKFSSRFGYDPNYSGGPRLEEAPEWLRVRYLNDILDQLTYVDHDTRYPNDDNRPLGIKKLAEDFHSTFRQESSEEFYDSWTCWDALKDLVKSVEWFNFYDFVELVAMRLRETELSPQGQGQANTTFNGTTIGSSTYGIANTTAYGAGSGLRNQNQEILFRCVAE